jgi:hypothetical protein
MAGTVPVSKGVIGNSNLMMWGTGVMRTNFKNTNYPDKPKKITASLYQLCLQVKDHPILGWSSITNVGSRYFLIKVVVDRLSPCLTSRIYIPSVNICPNL